MTVTALRYGRCHGAFRVGGAGRPRPCDRIYPSEPALNNFLVAATRTLLHQSPSGTHWAAILATAAAILSAAALLVGAAVAQRYLLRLTPNVEATCHPRPDGLLLHVRPSIASSGLVRVRLQSEAAKAPTVSVVEHQLRSTQDPSSEILVGPPATKEAFTQDRVVDPGETITDSLTFIVAPPSSATLGWRVVLTVSIHERKPWYGGWDYVATTFVAATFDVSALPSDELA